MGIKVEVKDDEVRQMLTRLYERVANMRPVMAEIGEIVIESVQRNFEQHRSPEGAPWMALSARYAKWKASKGRNVSDILIFKGASGGLLGTLNRRASKDRVVVGVNKVYAAIHQLGGRAGRKHAANIPARPYLGVRSEDWEEIKDALLRHITKGM